MSIIITIIIAPIVLVIGNWIALLPYFLSLGVSKNAFVHKYLSRIAMGGTVGLFFGLIEQLGANNAVLWIVFGVFLIFMSEPITDEIEAKISGRLKLVRGISFYFMKNIVWTLFLVI